MRDTTIRITVTKKHRASNADPLLRYMTCPVALAACELFEVPIGSITVGYETLTLHNLPGSPREVRFSLPDVATQAIRALDHGDDSHLPFTFLLSSSDLQLD
jgi:hypothetical protein